MTEKTLHVKKPRNSAKDDFAPEENKYEAIPQVIEEEIVSSRRDLDEMTLLDLFAMVVAPGVAKRLELPSQVAFESYEIAKEMAKLSAKYRSN